MMTRIRVLTGWIVACTSANLQSQILVDHVYQGPVSFYHRPLPPKYHLA